MLSSEEQMQILKEALLQGYQGPIFELIDKANVEAYQNQAQAAQQQSQETPSVGTPALGGEFEAKAPQSSTERNIIQPGQYKSGGIKKYTDGGVKLSMGAEANHECGPGVQNCGDRESPFTLQRYTGFNYNTGNKNVGMDLDLGTQFSFGKDDTRSGAPVLQTGLSGDASMNIESFKNSEVDNAFNYGVDAYAKVGYKRKSLSSSAKRTNSPGFEAGVYGNYDLLNKNINDVGVYGKYGAFTGNVGYNPQTKGGMLGIGLKFKEGGVRRYNHGGPHHNMTEAQLNALMNKIQNKNSTSKTNPTSKINTDRVSTTHGSYYYNKDNSPMNNKQVQEKKDQNVKDTKKYVIETGPHSIYNQKNIEIKLEDKPILNIEGVKKGIADAESLGGKLMLNPESTATGLYGQRFSELKGTNVYKGTREEFAKNLQAQEKVFELRLNKGMNGTKGLLRDSEEIYNEYAPQIKNFQYSKEDLIALTNFLGRQGVREYLGYHVRDQKPLDQALPKLYGKGAKQANKTPEEYLKIVRKHYQKGGVRKYHIKKCKYGGCL